MDNFRIQVTASGRENLLRVCEIVCGYRFAPRYWGVYIRTDKPALNPKPRSWKRDHDDPKSRPPAGEFEVLVFFGYNPNIVGAQAFPFALSPEMMAEVAWQWLAKRPPAQSRDVDISISPGWTAENEPWGHAGGSNAGILEIMPSGALHGK